MSPEKQRIAIAQYCGWHQSEKGWWFNREETNGGDPEPPDYLNDLNAMHEAILTLKTYKECQLFEWHLNNSLRDTSWKIINATAAQRAEAFLRTILKWEKK